MSSDGWGSSFKQLEAKPETLAQNNVPLNQSGDTAASLYGCIAPKTEVEVPDTIVFNNGAMWTFSGGSEPIKSLVWSSLGQIADEKFPYGKHPNKVPTHDPYTNPNAQLYYSCNCGAILDPGTRRFAELNNHASKAGWKIRFSDSGYVPYCVECGKGVE